MTMADTQNKISADGRLSESFGGKNRSQTKKGNRRSIILHTGKGCEGLWTEQEKTKYLIIKQEITTDEPYSKFGTETKIYNFERINVNSDEGVKNDKQKAVSKKERAYRNRRK
jgi:hypothetical protein